MEKEIETENGEEDEGKRAEKDTERGGEKEMEEKNIMEEKKRWRRKRD